MLLAAIAIIGIIVDQASKAYIRSVMSVGESIPLISGLLHVTYVKNSGAAFGILPNQKLVFLIVSIAVIIFILYYYRQIKVSGYLNTVAFGLVLGGAVGNLIDRVLFGKVTDFIDFRVWPVFNIADSSIVVGMILISYLMIKDTRRESREAAKIGQPGQESLR